MPALAWRSGSIFSPSPRGRQSHGGPPRDGQGQQQPRRGLRRGQRWWSAERCAAKLPSLVVLVDWKERDETVSWKEKKLEFQL